MQDWEEREAQRLRSLQTYEILDTLPESIFDDITILASQICQTPVALISFVDAKRQWFKSRVGLDAEETHRDLAFCHYTIQQDGVLTVEDAQLDERFSRNLLVTDSPKIRFYSGTVLKSLDGYALGSLCVIDNQPRTMTESQTAALEALGRQVMQLLEYRRTQLDYKKAVERAEKSQKQAEEAALTLAASESFLRLITDSIPAHIVYVGTDWTIKFANEHVAQTFAVPQSELKNLPISKLLTPEQFEQRKPIYQKALEGFPQVLKVEVSDRNHGLVVTKNVLTPDFDASGKPRGFVVIAYDQTAEEKLKAELLAASLDADAANAAKSAFLANMSHEIRSPLGAMMGFVELMRDGGLTLAEQKEYLEIITRNAGQVTHLIDDILDLSKVEAGKLEIEAIEFSMEDLLKDFAGLMRFRARENGIEFVIRTHASVPNFVITDPTRLKQILSNAVGNAIKFTREGRVEVDVTMRGDVLTLRIKDTGIGISDENATRLFEAFHQADSTITRKFGGTGLGLLLTRKLTQLLGGDFRLEHSELGKGSTFVATVRVGIADKSSRGPTSLVEIGKVERKTLTAQSFLSEKKILVVDDAPDNLLLMNRLLKRWGAQIEAAHDGGEAIRKAMREDFDIVLMDVQMPVMSGHEAVQSLRASGYKIPIIALTAHAMADERQKCLLSGFTDFLSKPIDRNEFLAVLERHLVEENFARS